MLTELLFENKIEELYRPEQRLYTSTRLPFPPNPLSLSNLKSFILWQSLSPLLRNEKKLLTCCLNGTVSHALSVMSRVPCSQCFMHQAEQMLYRLDFSFTKT